jgi:hypothetical protein
VTSGGLIVTAGGLLSDSGLTVTSGGATVEGLSTVRTQMQCRVDARIVVMSVPATRAAEGRVLRLHGGDNEQYRLRPSALRLFWKRNSCNVCRWIALWQSDAASTWRRRNVGAGEHSLRRRNAASLSTKRPVGVAPQVSASGRVTFNSGLTAASSLSVTGSSTIAGTFTVGGTSAITGNIAVRCHCTGAQRLRYDAVHVVIACRQSTSNFAISSAAAGSGTVLDVDATVLAGFTGNAISGHVHAVALSDLHVLSLTRGTTPVLMVRTTLCRGSGRRIVTPQLMWCGVTRVNCIFSPNTG